LTIGLEVWERALALAEEIGWAPNRDLKGAEWQLSGQAASYLGSAFLAIGNPALAPVAGLLGTGGEVHGYVENRHISGI
jgi:hypothetical protein